MSVFTDDCSEHEKDRWRKKIEDGLVVDGSVAVYTLNKKVYCLQLLIKLFDGYQFRSAGCTRLIRMSGFGAASTAIKLASERAL